MKNFPRPTGELMGDDKPMPDRGTSTGFNGDGYGADTSQDAINRQGGISSATKSSRADDAQCNELNKPGGC